MTTNSAVLSVPDGDSLSALQRGAFTAMCRPPDPNSNPTIQNVNSGHLTAIADDMGSTAYGFRRSDALGHPPRQTAFKPIRHAEVYNGKPPRMLKRIFVFVLMGALFVVGMQFGSVFFYLWQFDDFVNDEVKFAPVRENDSKEHLVEHIMDQARSYHLNLDPKDIRVEKHTDLDSGSTTLSVDLNYSVAIDLYYFTSQVRRHLQATTTY